MVIKIGQNMFNEHKEHTVSLLAVVVSIYKKLSNFSVLRPLREIGKVDCNKFLAPPLAIPQN